MARVRSELHRVLAKAPAAAAPGTNPHRGREGRVDAHEPRDAADGLGRTLSGDLALRATVSRDVVEVDRVEFRLSGEELDDELIGVATLTKPRDTDCICTWNTASVADGTYTLHGVAVDAAGNEGRSAGTTVTVRNGSRILRRFVSRRARQ